MYSNRNRKTKKINDIKCVDTLRWHFDWTFKIIIIIIEKSIEQIQTVRTERETIFCSNVFKRSLNKYLIFGKQVVIQIDDT